MKVGKNNFKPPPAVESSVIRMIPKNPRPQISYEEWDGLLRICFVRKNKVLRGNFLATTSVMDMLEVNYRTWCAQNEVLLDDSPIGEGEVVEDGGGVDGHDDEPEDMDWKGFGDEDGDDDDVPEFFRELAERKAKDHAQHITKRRRRGRVSELVREKVRRALEDRTDLSRKRARMCDEGDFLKLLWAFNEENIHFS